MIWGDKLPRPHTDSISEAQPGFMKPEQKYDTNTYTDTKSVRINEQAL